MNDDLVERIENVIAHSIDLKSTPRAIAERVLAIVRPAIVEEAAKTSESHVVPAHADGRAVRAAIASDLRDLTHTTGQEGGR